MEQLKSFYSLRNFWPHEAGAYRDIRLEALQNDAGMFGSSYAREAAFTAAQWLERITNKDTACLGLYRNDELIGITGIVKDKEDAGLAHLVQSYIRTEHRGKGLSALFYKERIEWAKEHAIKRIVVGHRVGNEAARAATLRSGFSYTHNEPADWPDGTTADIEYYELEIQ